MTALGAYDPDQCATGGGYEWYEWDGVRAARNSFPAITRLVDAALRGSPTACTWRALILHRAAIAPLAPAARQAEVLRAIRLYDRADPGDASHTSRNLKREVLRTAATYAGDVPNAAWNLAVRALREQFDPLALQWAILLIHLVLSDRRARTGIDATARNAALVELGRVATAAPDPAAPAGGASPDTWDGADPVPRSWYAGGREWAHRHGAQTIQLARTYFANWKHLMGRPCDPTLPPDDVGSIYQCYPDLRPERPTAPAPASREGLARRALWGVLAAVTCGGVVLGARAAARHRARSR